LAQSVGGLTCWIGWRVALLVPHHGGDGDSQSPCARARQPTGRRAVRLSGDGPGEDPGGSV